MKRILLSVMLLTVCAGGLAQEKAKVVRSLEEITEQGREQARAAATRGEYRWRALPSGPWWGEYREVLKLRGIELEVPSWCGNGSVDPKDLPENARMELETLVAHSRGFDETMRTEVIKKFGADIGLRADIEAQAMYEAKQKGTSGTPSPAPVEKRATSPSPAKPPYKAKRETSTPRPRSKLGGIGQ